ncbi:MAG TPA: hypothetical protein DEG26_00255 [Chloroflexi bacterium]|nr:hypothetical protein [Chloroflexota bacterium]
MCGRGASRSPTLRGDGLPQTAGPPRARATPAQPRTPLGDPGAGRGHAGCPDRRQHRRLHRQAPGRLPLVDRHPRLRERDDAEQLDRAQDLPALPAALPGARPGVRRQSGRGPDRRHGGDHRGLLRHRPLLLPGAGQRGEPPQRHDLPDRHLRHRGPLRLPVRVPAPARAGPEVHGRRAAGQPVPRRVHAAAAAAAAAPGDGTGHRTGPGAAALSVDFGSLPRAAGERDTLVSFLEWQRATLARKCSGLSAEQMRRRAVEPSTLSLLGLLRHMAGVERWWFRRTLAQEDVPLLYSSDADPDADFNDLDTAEVDEALATWTSECERARAIVEAHDLDDTGRHENGQAVSLRWILVHMIEEYSRHNGHADLLRERIDGAVGYLP